MTWKSHVDQTIWYCTFDGSTWSSQMNITALKGYDASEAPSLTVFNNHLFMGLKSNVVQAIS